MMPISLLPDHRAAFVRFCCVATALVAGLVVAVTPAPAAERGHGAHEHGVGQLSLAVEGNAVEVEITAPAADIVGFEHAAKTEADRAALAAAAARLKDAANLFRFPPKADCRLDEAKIESALLNGTHAEFRAHYRFRCADLAALTHVDLGYFKAFPAARELEARTITARGQGVQELTADRPRLTF